MPGIPRDAPGPVVSPPPSYLPPWSNLVKGWRKRFRQNRIRIGEGNGPRPLTFRTRGFRRG